MTGIDHGRRRTLGLLAGSIALAWVRPGLAGAEDADADLPRICLALGSGGARGLAHLLVFEMLDELGLRPARIAGSSAGAAMGALYAAGLSGAEIRAATEETLVSRSEGWFRQLIDGAWRRWIRFVDPTAEPGGFLESTALVGYLAALTGVERFEELSIPLQVVATDYWARQEVVFDTGDLWTAVKASIAMPGLFAPVRHDERVLVDGGLTNPVPFDVFDDDRGPERGAACDAVIAVDVLGVRTPNAVDEPSYFDNSFNTFQIMQSAMFEEKLRRGRPDFLVSPEIRDVRVLEFNRYEAILDQARPAVEALRQQLIERFGPASDRRGNGCSNDAAWQPR